jgi:hypothetical protein
MNRQWMSLSFLSKESNQRKVAAWSRPEKGSALSVAVPPVRYAMPHLEVLLGLLRFYCFYFPSLSAKQLRAKAGRTMVACGRQGHRNFCRSGGLCERSRAEDSSPWFWLICGVKALCGKEAFLLT